MKYTYVKNAMCDGWGCCGVWPKHIVDKAKTKKQYGKNFIILDISDIIVGQGIGWEASAIIDDVWFEKACELMNKDDAL